MSDVVVIDNPKWRPSKPLVYGVVSIVVVVALAGAFIEYTVAQNNTKKNDQKLDAAFKTATNARAGNGTASDDVKALSQLNSVSDLAKTNQQKVELYNNLALTYASTGNTQEALHYLQLKHQLDPSTVGADALTEAQLYQQLNDNSKAIAQYKLAISYVNSDHSMSASQRVMAVENDDGAIQSLESPQ